MASIISNLAAAKTSLVKNKSEKPPFLFTTAYQPGFPEVKSSRTFLVLVSKPQVLENYHVFGSRTALFFDLLKVYRSPEKLFWRPVLFGDRLKNCFEDLFLFFFGRTFAPVSLSSRETVLGRAVLGLGLGLFLCPWPWPWALCPRLHLCGFRSCNLCMTEKLAILLADQHKRSIKDETLRGNAGTKIKTSWKTFDLSFFVFNQCF